MPTGRESQPRTVRDGKVTRGRNGWLFIAEDANDALAQHSGALRLSTEKLEEWKMLLKRRLEFFGSIDCRYLMLVAPDTHAVYPENLPPEIEPASERPLHQLTKSLKQDGAPVELSYPLETLVAGKEARLVCSPVDSHWTDFGAYLVYSELLAEIGRSHAVRRLEPVEVAFYDVITAADLGSKFDPARQAAQPLAIVRYPSARLLYDNCIENTGSVVVTGCPGAPQTTCLLLGDSYSYPLLRFMSESFARLVLVHSVSLDRELARRIKPDVVVNLMAERFLIRVPDDDSPGQGDQERSKRAARITRPPLTSWSWHRWPSPQDAERLREHFLVAGSLRDATIVSVLAYAGLLPRELLRLRWSDVGENELHVWGSDAQRRTGGPPARSVRMIQSLSEDLSRWRQACAEALPGSSVFPGSQGAGWKKGDWQVWTTESFKPAAEACDLNLGRPDELRHTFSTLLAYEGASAKEIAEQIEVDTRQVEGTYEYLFRYAQEWEAADVDTLVRAVRQRPSAAARAVHQTGGPADKPATGDADRGLDVPSILR